MKKLLSTLALALAFSACAPAAPVPAAPEKPMAKRAAMEWKFESAGEVDGIPKTTLNLMTSISTEPLYTTVCTGTASTEVQDMGESVADVQCWWAGGSDQYGVFIGEAEQATIRHRTVDEEVGYGTWKDVQKI
jgi:hypothetical protein